MKPRYYVTTWDSEKDEFTPQKGVRTGPYSLFGIRKALRKLRQMGYPADRSDPSVLVDRVPLIDDKELAAWNALCETGESVN